MLPVSCEAYKLIHEGAIALAQVEADGIRVDRKYLRAEITKVSIDIANAVCRIKEDKIYRLWIRRFGKQANIGSRQQLGKILFEDMGLECCQRTQTGRPAITQETLQDTKLPFVVDYLQYQKLIKVRSTYLYGILREVDPDGFLHPFYNLHIAQTYRSSCDSPNFQNIPVRDEQMMQMVRRAFLPRPGNQLIEVDYSGAEVASATCYHHDPTMVEYIVNPAKDMHRDMSRFCYMLKKSDVDKKIRGCGKGMFVFSQFYGSYYVKNAIALWDAIDELGLCKPDGTSLHKHLRRKGIRERGACTGGEPPAPKTFEAHIKAVEDYFWNDLFPVYAQWKRDWYAEYLRTASFETLTGFRFEGALDRKKVINYPIQGTAFHWLLWSLTQVVNKELAKAKMRTRVAGQIHDSIVSDGPPEERDDYLALMNHIMTKAIRDHWTWIDVPLTIDADVAPVGAPWSEKAKYKME